MDMFPVRVLVETVRPQHCLSCSHDGQPIVDTYAVVSGQTVLNQLVESVLNALGMPHLVPDSRGLIQVNNWKPLSFENITDNPDEPIINLLKDINSSITLKILTKNPNGTTQTRFSQVAEIPRLERWFKQDPNPPRQKLISYMNMLNSSAYRKNNSKVTYQQICNWFSNQRAQNRTATLPSISQTTSIPVATLPIDVKAKFNGSNGYNPQNDGQSETDRIDGGSESPNGHDDASVHSMSDNDQDVKESLASSPDQQGFDFGLNGTLSPKRASSPSNTISSALQAMLPNFAAGNLPLAASNQLTQQFANIFSQMGNANFAALSKEFSSSNPATSRDSSTPSKTESKSSNGTGNENQREGSQSNTPNVARSRLMFDPLSELPILERWFEENPHPGWMQIEQYTDMLNGLPYRQNYPPISTHNVKIWFKNRRAKCKRLLTNDTGKLGGLNQFLQMGVRDELH
ncbi:hypothetical protein FO519_004805 [Halicephalobus sp. NKZ332]|nr:hypothetical protein FO519_004805 [Halicephalobus sp. NKZ332]